MSAALRPSRRARLARVLQKAALAAISSVLGIVACELIVRTFVDVQPFRYVSGNGLHWNRDDPRRDYALTPGYRGTLVSTEFEAEIEINSLGFRGSEPVAGAPRRQRIFFVGDSFTFGVGVDGHETLPARTEHHLSRRGQRVEVWNLGVPGYALQQYFETLEEYLEHAPNRVVVVVYAPSDLIDSVTFERKSQQRQAEEKGEPGEKRIATATVRLKKLVLRHSALYNLAMVRLGPTLRAWTHRRSPGLPETIERRGWEIFAMWLEQLRELGERRAFDILLVYIPGQPDVINRKATVGRRLGEYAARQRLRFIDGFSILTAKTAKDLYYSLDGHLNAAGYDFFAFHVAEALSEPGSHRPSSTSTVRSRVPATARPKGPP